MKPTICLVVGDNHTPHCGVKDYARRLAAALDNIGLTVELMAPADWGVKSFLDFCETLRQRQFNIVHVQYPSIGNRKSLCPHLLGMMRVAAGFVVTLHEYSALPALQRASTHVFRGTADCILFTTESEMMNYGQSGVMQRVIPIGSNVPAFSSELQRLPNVLYFGQIRPGKGLEAFLELARYSLQLGKPFKYQVIGTIPQRRTAYYEAIRAKSVTEVEWLIDLRFEEVAQSMAGSIAAYLPFPDGASYSRGSLLAALTNGLPVITTVGSATPHELRNLLLPSTSPVEALAHLERLYGQPAEVSALSYAEREFAARFSWAQIAHQHEKVYLETLSRVHSTRRWRHVLAPYLRRFMM